MDKPITRQCAYQRRRSLKMSRIVIWISKELDERIKAAHGEEPRQTWVFRAIERALEERT